MPACQRRVPDLITDGCEPPCGCWELNSGPLEEQAALLTTEPSLQPSSATFILIFRQGFSLNLGLVCWARQSGWWVAGILLGPQAWEDLHWVIVFIWVLGIQTEVLSLLSKHFTDRAVSQAPLMTFVGDLFPLPLSHISTLATNYTLLSTRSLVMSITHHTSEPVTTPSLSSLCCPSVYT